MKNKNRNKRLIFLSWLIFASPIFLAVFFVFIFIAKADSDELIVNEIMYDPKGTDSGHSDWIEIYNNSNHDVIFGKSDFGLIDEKEERDEITSKLENTCHTISDYSIAMKPGEYIIIADNKTNFVKDYPDCATKVLDTVLSLSNSGDVIKISLDRCKSWITELSYDDSWGAKNNGRTLELINYGKGYEKNNWQQSYQKGGTPGDKSSEKKKYEQKIYINEIYPKPAANDVEFIELYNATNKDVILDEWKIEDKAGKECLLDGKNIGAEKYVILTNDSDNDCDIALNDTSEEIVYLKDPNGEIVSTSESYKSAKAGQSFAFDGSKWRWTKKITKGLRNIFNNLPEEKKTSIPKEAYTNVYVDFSAKVSDADGDKVKITWDFGDGHGSYKAETRHKYQKEGKYTGNLKISDGSEDVIKEFTIKIEDYPERKVRIVAINANPVGKDTEGESITVLNKSKKKINFNGWSVATGTNSKKLSNHPIKEDFEIKPGKTGEITRDICALTLNNTKGKIELRYPGGEVAHDVKYKKPNKESIKEGEVYEKKGEKWEWIINKQQTTDNKQQDINKQLTTDDSQQEDEDLQLITDNMQQNPEDGISPEEVGGQSADLSLKPKPIEIVFASVPLEEKVLGAETSRAKSVYEYEGAYRFNNQVVKQPHYVVVFSKNLMKNLNALANALLCGLVI